MTIARLACLMASAVAAETVKMNLSALISQVNWWPAYQTATKMATVVAVCNCTKQTTP